MLDVRVGDRRGSPRYPYNAGSAGLVDGAGYLASKWGVDVGDWSRDNFGTVTSTVTVTVTVTPPCDRHGDRHLELGSVGFTIVWAS